MTAYKLVPVEPTPEMVDAVRLINGSLPSERARALIAAAPPLSEANITDEMVEAVRSALADHYQGAGDTAICAAILALFRHMGGDRG